MTEEAVLEAVAQAIPEAPASASVRCQIEGFEWLITIRGFETDGTAGRTLIEKIKPVNEAIIKMGGGPIFGRNGGKATPTGDVAPGEDPAEKACPIHNVMMKRRTNEKGSWYSHKLADDSWCNGGEKKK